MTSAKIEAALKGDFVGGDKPSAEDVKLFNELLGEKNTHVHRWVKNMASFTTEQRAAWGKASTVKPAVNFSSAVAAAPAAAVKKIAKSKVTAAITLKSGADAKTLESHIRSVKVEGLNFGTFKSANGVLTWDVTVEDLKVNKDDLVDMTAGFKNFVEKVDFPAWKHYQE